MKRFLQFLGVVLIIAALSVFLTPLIKWLIPALKFEKIFNRLIMVFAVTAAILCVRGRNESWQTYGIRWDVPWKKLFTYGFLIGFATVASVTLVEVAWGPRYVRSPIFLSDVLQRFFKGMLTGVSVGIVEEFFFRGFIFYHFSRWMRQGKALLVTSLFYSLCHFLDNGQIFIDQTNATWRDSVRLLFGYFEPFAFRPAQFLPEFFGLFIFGMLLNVAYLRTRSLYVAMGLHAGAVFCIKFQNALLRKGPEFFHPLYGNHPHYDGPIEWMMLTMVAVLIFWFPSQKKGL